MNIFLRLLGTVFVAVIVFVIGRIILIHNNLGGDYLTVWGLLVLLAGIFALYYVFTGREV